MHARSSDTQHMCSFEERLAGGNGTLVIKWTSRHGAQKSRRPGGPGQIEFI